MLKGPISATALLIAICFLVVTPFFWHGIPSGHDFEFHMASWMEVLSQWKQGQIYPRWAVLAHWGYGEARFLFYPPASWTLGAALGAILPWKLVPAAYIWLVLSLSGLSMLLLARRWLPMRDAVFAAAFYAVNPYHLLIVYWRSAFAELLAAALLPLLVLFILRLREPGNGPVLGLGLTLAAAWLTNAPAAVMIHYSAGCLAVATVAGERSWRPLWRMAVAVTLGAALAAFYLVPAVYEEKWVNISEVLAPGVRPVDNFLFTTIPDADHNRFNRLASTIAVADIAVVGFAMLLSRTVREQERRLRTPIAAWAAIAAVAMFSFTNPLWEHLPQLRFVQLPWRWLLCLNAALAILLTMASRHWSLRALACAGMLAVVLVAGYRIQAPWWDNADDIREMSNAMADGTGYEGTDEYVPAGADPYELKKDLPLVSDGAGNAVRVEGAQWSAIEKQFVVNADAAEFLTLRLFNYPAWTVTVNGKLVEAGTADVTGQIEIPVEAGRNDVRIRFVRTRDRTIGGAVSLFGIGVFGALWLWGKFGVPRTGAHSSKATPSP